MAQLRFLRRMSEKKDVPSRRSIPKDSSLERDEGMEILKMIILDKEVPEIDQAVREQLTSINPPPPDNRASTISKKGKAASLPELENIRENAEAEETEKRRSAEFSSKTVHSSQARFQKDPQGPLEDSDFDESYDAIDLDYPSDVTQNKDPQEKKGGETELITIKGVAVASSEVQIRNSAAPSQEIVNKQGTVSNMSQDVPREISEVSLSSEQIGNEGATVKNPEVSNLTLSSAQIDAEEAAAMGLQPEDSEIVDPEDPQQLETSELPSAVFSSEKIPESEVPLSEPGDTATANQSEKSIKTELSQAQGDSLNNIPSKTNAKPAKEPRILSRCYETPSRYCQEICEVYSDDEFQTVNIKKMYKLKPCECGTFNSILLA